MGSLRAHKFLLRPSPELIHIVIRPKAHNTRNTAYRYIRSKKEIPEHAEKKTRQTINGLSSSITEDGEFEYYRDCPACSPSSSHVSLDGKGLIEEQLGSAGEPDSPFRDYDQS